MAKAQKRGNKEARKPKKPQPPKASAAKPSTKGTPAANRGMKGGGAVLRKEKEGIMTKTEEYSAKAAASLAAAGEATNERDRAFHRRAHTIWRKLMQGISDAEERAAMQPVRSTPRAATAGAKARS